MASEISPGYGAGAFSKSALMRVTAALSSDSDDPGLTRFASIRIHREPDENNARYDCCVSLYFSLSINFCLLARVMQSRLLHGDKGGRSTHTAPSIAAKMSEITIV